MATKPKFFDLDQRFEQFLESVKVDFVESDFTEEKRQQRRARAETDDLEFCKIYFPTIFYLPWNDMHKSLANLVPGMYTREGFRKSGKSATTYIILLVKAIAQNVGGLIGLNCETLDIADEKTAALKRLIMRNRLLCYDYDINLVQDLKGYYIFGDTHLLAGAMTKGLRARTSDEFKRFKRIVNDDMYDRTNVTSKNHCARVVEFVESECSGQMEDDGICVTLGNAISENAPILELAESNPRNHFSLPALDENNQSNWEEYMADAGAWEEYRKLKNISYDVWMGDYMSKPSIQGGIFDPEWFRDIAVNTIDIITTISAADPAFGASPSACYKSLITGSWTNKDTLIIEDIYLRKESYDKFFDYCDFIRGQIPRWAALMFENDFSQWTIAKPYYDKWSLERKKILPIQRHFTSQLATEERGTDKVSRIMNLVYPHQVGQIVYRDGVLKTPDGQRLKAQLISFGKVKDKLDGPDAMATLFIMIRRWSEQGNFKSIKQRVYDRVETWFRGSGGFR